MGNRKTTESLNAPQHDPVKGATHVYAGNIVCLDANGFAVPGAAAAGLIARGVSQEEVNNTGADGADLVKSRIGVYGFDVKAGDEPTQADIGSLVYITGAFEVGKTATGRSPAGYLTRIEGTQAFVDIDGKVHV